MKKSKILLLQEKMNNIKKEYSKIKKLVESIDELKRAFKNKTELTKYIASKTKLKPKDDFIIKTKWSSGYIIIIAEKKLNDAKKQLDKIGLKVESIGIGFDYNMKAYHLYLSIKEDSK